MIVFKEEDSSEWRNEMNYDFHRLFILHIINLILTTYIITKQKIQMDLFFQSDLS